MGFRHPQACLASPLQMTNQGLSHKELLRGIELLGTRVAPVVRGTSVSKN